MADARTNIVLSGDPKQLGPIVRSKIASQLGLGASLLDRLMVLELYNEDTMSGITYVVRCLFPILKSSNESLCVSRISLTKLTKNWRSHRSILEFSNEQFYRGQLEVCGSPAIINSLLDSSIVAAQNEKEIFPVIFHAIEGTPSYTQLEGLAHR